MKLVYGKAANGKAASSSAGFFDGLPVSPFVTPAASGNPGLAQAASAGARAGTGVGVGVETGIPHVRADPWAVSKRLLIVWTIAPIFGGTSTRA